MFTGPGLQKVTVLILKRENRSLISSVFGPLDQ